MENQIEFIEIEKYRQDPPPRYLEVFPDRLNTCLYLVSPIVVKSGSRRKPKAIDRLNRNSSSV
jgi:hypothetical protein